MKLPSAFSHSLRAKVTLAVALPLIVILGAVTIIDYRRHEAAVLTNLSLLAAQTNEVIENGLMHVMSPRNQQGMQAMLDAISEGQGIHTLYLLDDTGRVLFAPKGIGVGQRLDNHAASCQPCHGLPSGTYPSSAVVDLPDGTRVFRSMNPILNRTECQACHEPQERVLGLLLTDLDVTPMEASLAADTRDNLVRWAGTILITVLVVNLVLSRFVIRRIEGVAGGLARFGRGQLNLRLPEDSPDEIGHLSAAFNQMAGRVQAEEAENRELSADLERRAAEQHELVKRLITAQEDERRRVARDLHDDLGQELAGLSMGLEVVARALEARPEQARAQLQQMRAHVAQTTDRTYEMILALRPPSLDELGLVPALQSYAVRTLERAGIRYEVNAGEAACRLPPDAETAVFRIVQEALSNVVRHSRASLVHLSFAVRDGGFEAEVRDDGCGFDPSSIRSNGHDPRGLGLLGMQERAAQCGGTVEVESAPGQGTRLCVRVPLQPLPECGEGDRG